MNKDMLRFVLKYHSDIWLKENPLLLNSQEKQKFLKGLDNYLENKDVAIDDEVYDFLVQRKLIDNEPREDSFIKYLNKKYGSLRSAKILDVGSGRVCALSKAMAEQGANVTAIDTNIRLSSDALRKSKITAIKKLFRCDEYSKNGVGTNIEDFDLIVGLEPCDATEHIIRQSLKYDKPFDISLCAAPHVSLSGQSFRSYMDWYKYLESISKEISINKYDLDYIATNNLSLDL